MNKNTVANRVLRVLIAVTIVGVIAALLPGEGVAQAGYRVFNLGGGGVKGGPTFD